MQGYRERSTAERVNVRPRTRLAAASAIKVEFMISELWQQPLPKPKEAIETSSNRRWIVFASVVGVWASSVLSTHALGSQWILQEEPDPFTDEVAATAYATSSEDPSRVVAVRCGSDKKFTVYVIFGEYLGNSRIDIQYRIDKGSVASERWFPAAGGTAVFARQERHLARQLMEGSMFIVSAVDFRGVKYVAAFDLAGSSNVIGPVLEYCGIPSTGMHQEVDGLRLEVSLQIERWGPQNVYLNKEVLSGLGEYDGPLDSACPKTDKSYTDQ